MTIADIRLLHPGPASSRPLALDDLIDLLAPADRSIARVRANAVSSVDGSATVDGLSGGLGGPADLVVFDLLRRLSDVVVVGAGTARDEGYGPLVLSDDAVSWREGHDLAPHPVLALVSASLRLDPSDPIVADAPVRPIVVTTESSDREARVRLEEVADVVTCGVDRVDPRLLVSALVARGLRQIHTEGGPSLLGDVIAADLLDEICVTVSPGLEGGGGPRIASNPESLDLRALHLDHVLLSGDMLLSKYSRRR